MFFISYYNLTLCTISLLKHCFPLVVLLKINKTTNKQLDIFLARNQIGILKHMVQYTTMSYVKGLGFHRLSQLAGV